MTTPQFAIRQSLHNRSRIEKSQSCGCYFCITLFPPGEIEDWIDEGKTALCPRCDIDAVIADPPDLAFLAEAHEYWFCTGNNQNIPDLGVPNLGLPK